jgi:hypothetical protein
VGGGRKIGQLAMGERGEPREGEVSQRRVRISSYDEADEVVCPGGRRNPAPALVLVIEFGLYLIHDGWRAEDFIVSNRRHRAL